MLDLWFQTKDLDIIKEKLKKLGFVQTNKIKSIAQYSPYVFCNDFIYVSGQLPILKNKLLFSGKLGKDLKIKEVKKAIFIATCNLLLVLEECIKKNKLNLNYIRAINIKGYINSKSNITQHSKILDEASSLILKVLKSNNGLHSRSVIGVKSLPMKSSVEIEGIFATFK